MIKPLFLLIALALTACFQVREPAAPNSDSGFQVPNAPDIVLDNLSNAYANLNPENFIRSFKEEQFKFIPFSGANINPSLFLNWGLRKEERDVLINLSRVVVPNSQRSVNITTQNTNFLSVDSIELSATYNLSFITTDTSFNTLNVQGRAIFIMVRNQATNEWRITQWNDFSSSENNSPNPTWTELKLRYITQ